MPQRRAIFGLFFMIVGGLGWWLPPTAWARLTGMPEAEVFIAIRRVAFFVGIAGLYLFWSFFFSARS